MNDDRITTLLRQSMRQHEAGAPTHREVLDTLGRLPEGPQRPRPWGTALLAAAAILLVVAASAVWAPHWFGGDPAASGTPAPGTRVVTIFLGSPTSAPLGAGSEDRSTRVVPLQVVTTDTGRPVEDALHALFTQPSSSAGENWLQPRGEQLLDVRGVTLTDSVILVDLASLGHDISQDPYADMRCALPGCPSSNDLLQQVAWTVSTALRSEAAIAFTVNGVQSPLLFGARVDGGGRPDPNAIQPGDQGFDWYQDVCGPFSVDAHLPDGRRVPIDTVADGPQTSVLVLAQGEEAALERTGTCFQQFNVSFATPAVGHVRGSIGEHPQLVADQAGTSHVTISLVGSCHGGFDNWPPCRAPRTVVAYFDLVVEP